MVAVADAAAEIEAANREAGGAQFENQLGEASEGIPERPEIDELRADMHRQADRLDPRQFRREPIGLAGVFDIDAEFVLLFAGGDLGVGQRVDVGVDPQRDAGGLTPGNGDLAEPPQFGDRLDIDLVDSGGKRRLQLLPRLADAGEDDMPRRDPAARARRNSPADTTSAPAPRRAKSRKTARLEFALTA